MTSVQRNDALRDRQAQSQSLRATPAVAPLPRYQARLNDGVVEVCSGATDSTDTHKLHDPSIVIESGNETKKKAAQ